MYDYSNLNKTLEAKKAEREAKEGLLPEGNYTVELREVIRDATRQSGFPRWTFRVSIIAENTIYDGAERKINFLEMNNKFGEEQMDNFVAFLQASGFKFVAFSSHAEGEKKIRAYLEGLARLGATFDVIVENQNKKDEKTGEWVIDPKHQKFTIDIPSVTDMSQEVANIENQRRAKTQTPIPVVKKEGPKPYEAPEEEVEEEQEAPEETPPPPAKRSTRPNPFAK